MTLPYYSSRARRAARALRRDSSKFIASGCAPPSTRRAVGTNSSRVVTAYGKEHYETLTVALNYASSLLNLARFEEAKPLLRKMRPVARRVLGDDAEIALRMRAYYASSLYEDPGATLDDLRDAVTTLEDTERTARRILGGAHPNVGSMEESLQQARATLRARETSSSA